MPQKFPGRKAFFDVDFQRGIDKVAEGRGNAFTTWEIWAPVGCDQVDGLKLWELSEYEDLKAAAKGYEHL